MKALAVTVPAPTPELVQLLTAAASPAATVEVVGRMPEGARRNVPAVGVVQALAVPLLPAEAVPHENVPG